MQKIDMNVRLKLLRSMLDLIRTHQDAICEAVALDMGRSEIETHISEIVVIKEELKLFIKNLKTWDIEKNVSTPFQLWPARSSIYYEAYGKVLIIAPWNFPFHLSLVPAIGAFAAGNEVIIKTSPHAPHSSALLCKLINEVLESNLIRVVEGDETKTKQLIENGIDFVFFTGSAFHGREVYKLAANYLLPVVMELGGQNPLIFHKDGAIKGIKRIVWGKFLNAGQTCLSPNHVFVHESQYQAFVHGVNISIASMFGNQILENTNYPKIINIVQFERLVALAEENSRYRIFGGANDSQTLKIAPAIYNIPIEEATNSTLISQEIFGPLLPVIVYRDVDEVFKITKEFSSPLAVYLFTSDKNLIKEVKHMISSGSICVNDCLVQGANPEFPFGGVHQSGIGAYHGYHSFLIFSHAKSILVRSVRYGMIPRFQPMSNFIKRILKGR